jgi:hypothetical protein
VRVVNPFLAAEGVHELPALYETEPVQPVPLGRTRKPRTRLTASRKPRARSGGRR